jgi:hypothetical protein
MPWPLYSQGKSPWYPLYKKLRGPQSRSRRGGEEKNSQPLPGLEPPIIQQGDEIKEDEVGGVCSTHEELTNTSTYKVLIENTSGEVTISETCAYTRGILKWVLL